MKKIITAFVCAFSLCSSSFAAVTVEFTAPVGGTSGSLPWGYPNSQNDIYLGSGYNTPDYANAYNALPNPPTGYRDAGGVSVLPVGGGGYSTFTLAVKGSGTYSFSVLQPGTALNDPTSYDLMSILYASTKSTTPFDPNNPTGNLVALNDDANPPGFRANPYPLIYINNDPNACVTFTLAYFSWAGAPNSQATIRATGDGEIAQSCAQIPSNNTPAAIPTLGQWAMIFMVSLMAMFGIRRMRRSK